MPNQAVLNTSASLVNKTLATLEGTQTFTGVNTFTGANVISIGDGTNASPTLRFASNSDTGLYAASATQLDFTVDSVATCRWTCSPTPEFLLYSGAYGTAGAAGGSRLAAGHNSSGSGAPGMVQLMDKAGTSWYIWVDTTGDLRIGSTAPRADNVTTDTSGTVVGTQT